MRTSIEASTRVWAVDPSLADDSARVHVPPVPGPVLVPAPVPGPVLAASDVESMVVVAPDEPMLVAGLPLVPCSFVRLRLRRVSRPFGPLVRLIVLSLSVGSPVRTAPPSQAFQRSK